jgi:hypothetical protein
LAPTAHEAIAGVERLVDDVIAATDPRAWQADASPAIPGVSQPFPGDNPKTPASEAIASHWQPMATVNLMPIPDFQTMMRPVLVAIEGDEPQSTAQIRDMVATVLNISDEDRLVMLPSGKQALFTNRVAWAITHMSQAGLLTRPGRGRYLLSKRGEKVLVAL